MFRKSQEWLKEHRKLGLKTNVRTVNEAKDMQWLIDNNIDFITTNEPVILQEILSK